MVKKFLYVCAALLCLVVAHHLGASRASAQSGMSLVTAFDPGLGSWAVTNTGDVYFAQYGSVAAVGRGALVQGGNDSEFHRHRAYPGCR